MTGNRPGGRYGGPWYARFPEVLRFTGGTKEAFPGVATSVVPKVGFRVTIPLEVPGYDGRIVTILFRKASPRWPIVMTDGPTMSKHRNPDGSLCMWYPWDDEEQRWVFEDGLRQLIALAALHLFREAWWRETGEWLGPEAPHGAPTKGAAGPLADAS